MYYEGFDKVLIERINKVCEEIAEYQSKMEDTELMRYFSGDKDLGRKVSQLLKEFENCIKDPNYFLKYYANSES